MAFARDFFDLQFSFAETVRELSGGSLAAALLAYTNLYVRFGLGRAFDADHPGWRRYVSGLETALDGREWTYRVYSLEPEAHTAPRVEATFGCFSYARPDNTSVRLHFRSTDPDGGSPLGSARAGRRRAELAALFAHLRPRLSDEAPIVGASWLYNLAAYRRLFPPAYVASASPVPYAFRSMALWGQFLDHRGQVRRSLSEPFVAALARTSRVRDLDRCFPFQALTVSAPARDFHDFYAGQPARHVASCAHSRWT